MSCRSSLTTTAARNKSHAETAAETIYITDSVYVHDSIHIREKPDTIWIERWRTRWRYYQFHDTVFERVTDTIHETEYVERLVEKTSPWGKAGWVTAAVLFILVVVKTLIKTLLNKF